MKKLITLKLNHQRKRVPMTKIIKLPVVGRVVLGTDRFGSATRGQMIGGQVFETNLSAKVIRNGKELKAKDVMPSLNWLDKLRFGNKTSIDLGSGLVTNVGVLA